MNHLSKAEVVAPGFFFVQKDKKEPQSILGMEEGLGVSAVCYFETSIKKWSNGKTY